MSPNECHIGNILGDQSNSLNIKRRINKFICNVNYINSVFKHATFEVKIVLINSYCLSLFACVLWDFSSDEFNQFCTTTNLH